PSPRAPLDHPYLSKNFANNTRCKELVFAAPLYAGKRPAQVVEAGMLRGRIEIDGKIVEVGIPDALLGLLGRPAGTPVEPSSPTPDENAVRAPVPGVLALWRVSDGDRVEAGDVVAVMDAMKMETTVAAPHGGRITLLAKAGSLQTAGAVIARIAPADAGATEAAEVEE
ncbi:MAG: acetyl-CoA carboxylase biotin carboxyl carrier protein subunit, partial [Mesorhizobium sp.]